MLYTLRTFFLLKILRELSKNLENIIEKYLDLNHTMCVTFGKSLHNPGPWLLHLLVKGVNLYSYDILWFDQGCILEITKGSVFRSGTLLWNNAEVQHSFIHSFISPFAPQMQE
jgi:hypothetical protein